VNTDGLDVLQADAAAAVAGWDEVVVVVGPAGTGKTRMLTRAAGDLDAHRRAVQGLAPTAKAARVLERDTGMPADTVAKLLYEWSRPDLEPNSWYRLPAGTTVVVDEAGMIGTHDLHLLVGLAQRNEWRLVLVGDPDQLQAVGRGGLFAELCRNGRVHELEQIHRFTHRWEAEASLLLRAGDPRALDAYEARGRIIPGTLEEHLEEIAKWCLHHHRKGQSVALVASTNEHVDLLNAAVQDVRLAIRDLDPDTAVDIGGGEVAHVGEVVATRRNDRRLTTTDGEPVRNRELWTVTATHLDGSVTVSHIDGDGEVSLPADYVREHVRLGYAATEHGHESDTLTVSIGLVGAAATRRGLYVAATRGREQNWVCVITDSRDVVEARDVLERILTVDRADIPAVTQRRQLAEQDHDVAPARRVERTGRCEIPEWFDQRRTETRRELADVEQRAAANAATRERLEAELHAAERDLHWLDLPTGRQRQDLAAARHQLDSASRDQQDAQRRLDRSGLRGRRDARRELTAAENRVTWANHTLEQVCASVSPDVDRYHQTTQRVRELREALGRHETHELLDRYIGVDRIPHLTEQLQALDSWWRFALGDRIDVNQLSEIVDLLGTVDGDHGHYRWLAEAVEQYCHAAAIDLPSPESATPGIESPSLDIGL
jgi:hypothetical protein